VGDLTDSLLEHRSAYTLRDWLREMADDYETVAALDRVSVVEGVRTRPGSRVPPGAQEVLDADETSRALAQVDEWADFMARVLLDEADDPTLTIPDSTPARLRLVGDHITVLLQIDDPLMVATELGPAGTLDVLRSTMRHLAHRGERVIQTGRRCQEGACTGRLVSRETSDGALVCDRDARHVVPWSVWSSWPRMRVQWITVEHAARMLGTTVAAVKMRASRGQWRRVGTGRDVRYSVDDVRGAAEGDVA